MVYLPVHVYSLLALLRLKDWCLLVSGWAAQTQLVLGSVKIHENLCVTHQIFVVFIFVCRTCNIHEKFAPYEDFQLYSRTLRFCCLVCFGSYFVCHDLIFMPISKSKYYNIALVHASRIVLILVLPISTRYVIMLVITCYSMYLCNLVCQILILNYMHMSARVHIKNNSHIYVHV